MLIFGGICTRYVYEPDMLLLLLSLLPSIHIIFVIYSLYLLLFFHILLACDIWGQILYDTLQFHAVCDKLLFISIFIDITSFVSLAAG